MKCDEALTGMEKFLHYTICLIGDEGFNSCIVKYIQPFTILFCLCPDNGDTNMWVYKEFS